MAFSGCSITSGLGRGLVTDTGMNTRRLAKAFEERKMSRAWAELEEDRSGLFNVSAGSDVSAVHD